MTDQTESDGLDHTRTGVHEGRLLHASPILPAAVESASEYAVLLAAIDEEIADFDGYPGLWIDARDALRALEAKVEGFRVGSEAMARAGAELRAERDRLAEALAVEQRVAKGWQETAEKFRGERDRLDLEAARLAGEVERLHVQLETALALKNQERERNDWLLKRIAEGQALMPPAPMMLLDQSAEVARLTSELAAARENEARYLWLRDAEWPMDVWEAVTHRSNAIWDEAIDVARRAGEGEES